MKTRVVIKAWNNKPLSKEYPKKEYEKVIKFSWESLITAFLDSVGNPNDDEFEIESVEIEE